MAAPSQQLHRRNSSRDEEDDNSLITKPSTDNVSSAEKGLPTVAIKLAPPPRIRAQSTPHNHGHNRSSTYGAGTNPPPPLPASFRSNFAPRPLINGHTPGSPFRSSFSVPLQPYVNGHSRTRSISTPFSPLPSPLSASFPTTSSSPTTPYFPPNVSISHSAPDASQVGNELLKGGRRHTRLHSRNLSFFFPRPGSNPQGTINEDDAQELEVPVDVEAPLVPPAGSNINFPGSRSPRPSLTPLGQGFTFGARPPSSQGPTPDLMTAQHTGSSTSSSASRRGHHHKHSLSHNFFSFLEPGSTPPLIREEGLRNQPISRPLSPWDSVSALPAPVVPSKPGFNTSIPNNSHTNVEQHRGIVPGQISYNAVAVSAIQFVLGAWLWVSGQQVGSISCTGLGYWVVFDSFGVALSKVIPGWLSRSSNANAGFAEKEKERIRRPFGNGRVETVLMFAQAVYLMFSSVYVCKETVEHLLLSSGEGHHHHHGDEIEGLGIDFPIFMILITFISLLGTAIFYQNNTTIVNVTGNRIPSLGSIVRSLWSTSRHTHELPPTTTLTIILSNPFIACPLFFCVSILSVALILSPGQHRVADLILASLIAAVTFKVAYRSSLVLGTVLLQTSPRRGLSNGKMEAFLRAMREVERHPQVVHLPAPHIWQLTPSLASQTSSTAMVSSKSSNAISDSLVVTLELHVKEDLGDDDVLLLTKWAWERCVSALGNLKDLKGTAGGGGPEVTVGIVRG